MIVGGDIVFAHAGDSRAYLVRDGIAMQLTEDHTLLARLLAAGVDVDVDGEGMRFKSMLTNALGIGEECKVSTFVVPLADGDRFLLCSDGITRVRRRRTRSARSCPRCRARRARRSGSSSSRSSAAAATTRRRSSCACSRPARRRGPRSCCKRDQLAIQRARCGREGQRRSSGCARCGSRCRATTQAGEKLPAQTLGDRVAWIVVEGELEPRRTTMRGPGSLVYPEALLADAPLPDKDGLARRTSDVRALALRADDFRELCDDDPELGEALLGCARARRSPRASPADAPAKIVVQADAEAAKAPIRDRVTPPTGPPCRRARSRTPTAG